MHSFKDQDRIQSIHKSWSSQKDSDNTYCESVGYVGTKFNWDADCHDQIDKGQSIQLYLP